MATSRTEYFAHKIFRAGDLSRAIRTAIDAVFSESHVADISLFRTLPDGTKRTTHGQALSAIEDLCDLSTQGSLLIDVVPAGSKSYYARDLQLHVSGSVESISLEASAEDPEKVTRFIETVSDRLGLQPGKTPYEVGREEAQREAADQVERETELLRRVTRLEHRLDSAPQPLTCFLSFQFSEPSQSYARTVKHFLELLGVRVLTGEGYEPRTIQDKVRQRLAAGLDVVVLIESASKKSAWTRDEIAVAQGPGVYLIPLVERGATFDNGIFGEHEYIAFDSGHIGDALVGLLEGILFVQRMRSSDRDPDPAA